MTLSGQTLALDEEARISARRIFSLIANELQQVEIEFERQARSNVQVIAYLGDYLRKSGGKRVRPALTILSNYAVGGEGNRYNSIRMATVMEFLHTATLVHDDIIDNADTRRNRPTVNALYGNETAVLMGDWLYMSAFETSLAERSLPILDILTSVTRKMTEGELLQLTLLGQADVSEAHYLDVLKRKTAYLFSASCEIGGILGGATETQQTALRDYGMNLGIAFQLIDDLLDFTADEACTRQSGGSRSAGWQSHAAVDLFARGGAFDAPDDPASPFRSELQERHATGSARRNEPYGCPATSSSRGRRIRRQRPHGSRLPT